MSLNPTVHMVVLETHSIHGIHKAGMGPVAVMYCHKRYPSPTQTTHTVNSNVRLVAIAL